MLVVQGSMLQMFEQVVVPPAFVVYVRAALSLETQVCPTEVSEIETYRLYDLLVAAYWKNQ